MSKYKVGAPETTVVGDNVYFHIPISVGEKSHFLDLVASPKHIDLEGAFKEAEAIAKALNLHDTLVAVVECSQALGLPWDSAWVILEKHGWDYNKRFDLAASQFVYNLQIQAYKAINT